MEWHKGVTRCEIELRTLDRVYVGFASCDENGVACKKSVSFVKGQFETIFVDCRCDSVTPANFSPILNFLVIRERHFSQAHEGEKAC